MKKTSIIPIPVKKAMAQLGADLKDARIKRSLTMSLIEERAGITHVTLTKVEKGDPTVSMGIYAKVTFVLGLIDNLYDLANPDKDELGRRFDRENLPKRVRYKKNEV
jgi:transcriptional regulator with XRE-family HTH domain